LEDGGVSPNVGKRSPTDKYSQYTDAFIGNNRVN
jgi:hypothetical protein